MSNEIIVRRWWDDTAEKRVVEHPEWYGPIGIVDFYTEETRIWPVSPLIRDMLKGPAQIGLCLECLNADRDINKPTTTDEILERLIRGENFPEYTGEVIKRDYGYFADPNDLFIDWRVGQEWVGGYLPHIPGDFLTLLKDHYIMGNSTMFAYDGAEQTLWDAEAFWTNEDYHYGYWESGGEGAEPFYEYSPIKTCLASILINLGKAVRDFRSSVISYEIRGSLLQVPGFSPAFDWTEPGSLEHKLKVFTDGGQEQIKLCARVRLFYPLPRNEDGGVEAGLISQDWSDHINSSTSGLLVLPKEYTLLTDNIFEVDWYSQEALEIGNTGGWPYYTIPADGLNVEGWWQRLGYIDIDTGVCLESLYSNRLVWFSGTPTSKAVKNARNYDRRGQRDKTIPRRPRVTIRSID
jgi:hypothetical protein